MIENRQLLLSQLSEICKQAGAVIMEIYHSQNEVKQIQHKKDGSPVTLADECAEAIIIKGLHECAPNIHIVSEENSINHKQEAPECFFLVDPLDGTKEFIKNDNKGSFTVNIALIENNEATLGVVYAPALDRMFIGDTKIGAFENGKKISVSHVPKTGAIAIASASHRDDVTDKWIEKNEVSKVISIGSSLKICLVANGEAHLYPRFGPTMEWDIAAGHAVLRAASGNIITPEGNKLNYGKKNFLNSAFVAHGNLSHSLINRE